jgi:hypothetical protein
MQVRLLIKLPTQASKQRSASKRKSCQKRQYRKFNWCRRRLARCNSQHMTVISVPYSSSREWVNPCRNLKTLKRKNLRSSILSVAKYKKIFLPRLMSFWIRLATWSKTRTRCLCGLRTRPRSGGSTWSGLTEILSWCTSKRSKAFSLESLDHFLRAISVKN